jgi:hypothetical protein
MEARNERTLLQVGEFVDRRKRETGEIERLSAREISLIEIALIAWLTQLTLGGVPVDCAQQKEIDGLVRKIRGVKNKPITMLWLEPCQKSESKI